MDWREELRDIAGASGLKDEENIVDLSDIAGWEFLGPEHLEKAKSDCLDFDHAV